MKKRLIIISLSLAFIFVSCNFKKKANEETSEKGIDSLEQTIKSHVFNLSDFDIEYAINQEFANDTCVDHVAVMRGNRTIYSFSKDDLFVFSNNLKPKQFNLGKSKTLLFLTCDDRPFANKTISLLIENGVVVKVDTLPEFDNISNKIENVFNLKLSGYIDVIDAYCLDCDSSYYNPILIYKITSDGVVLDSVETIKKNKNIWGEFYGYEQSYDIIVKRK